MRPCARGRSAAVEAVVSFALVQVATPSARRIARWWPGPHAWWRLEVAARTAGLAAIAVFFVHRGLLHAHLSAEHLAFWGVRDGVLYEAPWLAERTGGPIPFVYSPAFAQAIAPLAALPLAAFAAAWMGLQLAALVWLAGPVLAGVLVWTFFPLWATNLWAGAIYIPTAAAFASRRRDRRVSGVARLALSPAGGCAAERSAAGLVRDAAPPREPLLVADAPDRAPDDRPSRGRTSERDLPWPRSLAFRPDLGR